MTSVRQHRRPNPLVRVVGGPVIALCIVTALARAETPAATAAPSVGSPQAPAWTSALSEYARDPVENRRALDVLRRQDPAALPPVALLVLADADLRTRNTRAAARLFEAVRAGDAGEPWMSYAELGLGGIALQSGDLETARAYYQQARASGGPSSGPARLLLAVIESFDGDPASATSAFEALANDGVAPEAIRSAARLGAAYARYWSGDDVGAASAFDAAAATLTDQRLVDDARYGSARVRWRAGDAAGARWSFATLAASSTAASGGGRKSRALVALDRRALLRNGFEQYRKAPVQPPEASLAMLFDLDAPGLARAALTMMDRGELARPARPAAAASDRRHAGEVELARNASHDAT